jgi:hypothetical protein
MRREDIKRFEEPYADDRIEADRRFHKFNQADIPGANTLVREILHDLDESTYGVRWMTGLPDQERVLISDYLYQCAYSIETNMVEAKLHILEWLDARDKHNKRIADVVSYEGGELKQKMPPALAPIDELPSRLGDLHVCGFFQAIGSSLDCLSALVVGVLGLPTGLRRCDVGTMEAALERIPKTAPAQQSGFPDFYDSTKSGAGPDDWLNWTNQVRNMLIHRGRRIIHHSLVQRANPLLDSKGKTILRCDATTHLPKDPDRTDVEAWIRSPDIVLSEDAGVTLNGVFVSCSKFEREICERLVSVWQDRRTNPALIAQPDLQWDQNIRSSNFNGYKPSGGALRGPGVVVMSNPIVVQRMKSSAVMDQQRSLWTGSPYVK